MKKKTVRRNIDVVSKEEWKALVKAQELNRTQLLRSGMGTGTGTGTGTEESYTQFPCSGTGTASTSIYWEDCEWTFNAAITCNGVIKTYINNEEEPGTAENTVTQELEIFSGSSSLIISVETYNEIENNIYERIIINRRHEAGQFETIVTNNSVSTCGSVTLIVEKTAITHNGERIELPDESITKNIQIVGNFELSIEGNDITCQHATILIS